MNMKTLAIGCLALVVTAAGCQTSPATPEPQTAGRSAPIKLTPGLGPVHHPVTTGDPDAQRYFDQGLAYLYAFNHDAAARSFDRAAELDPKLAMAHWGRALALGPNYNLPEIDQAAAKSAHDAAQRALALSANNATTKGERALIEAVAVRYPASAKADWRKPAYDYKVAMGEVVRKFPEDLDAATLYAEAAMNLRPWKLYAKDGRPEEGTEEIVRVLEWVMARNSSHTGANHYYIHATEASTAPERALPAARRLPKLAPAAGHLVHMPAHVYMRTGDYAAAIRANADAARVDENFISCCGPKGKGGIYPTLYYSHNLHFLAVAAAMAGRSAEAADAARRLAANIEPVADASPAAETFAAAPLLLAARQAQWGEIAKWPEPPANRPATRAAWHLARGLARTATKEVGPALEEHDKFAAELAKIKDVPMGNNTAGRVFAVGDHLLTAKVFAARGDDAEARKQFDLAIRAQDDLDYDEPAYFPWPVREALGAYLLRAGDPAAAEKVFRDDLIKTPNNPRSLFGLAEALKARGRHFDADEVRKQFDARWSAADLKLRVEDF